MLPLFFLDYVKKGIRCNAVCPARIHTPFVDSYLGKNYPGKVGASSMTTQENDTTL
jgi:NAD(P)-dependent dehydrogenase (short-subunit alcohol dehydrogenase family)